jgi:hypothetical protein
MHGREEAGGGGADAEIIDEKFGQPILATIRWVGTGNMISWFPLARFSGGL